MGIPGRDLRPRHELEAAKSAAELWLSRVPKDQFALGAIEAYRWLLGETHVSPATRMLLSPTIANMRTEETTAQAVIHRRRSAADVQPDFAGGIEHALMWARNAADSAPVPLDRAV